MAPGSASRILSEFEAEAAHRRALEVQQASFVVRDTHIGQALAFMFVLVMVGLIAFAISEDQPWVATILGGGLIASGITAFLRGRGE